MQVGRLYFLNVIFFDRPILIILKHSIQSLISSQSVVRSVTACVDVVAITMHTLISRSLEHLSERHKVDYLSKVD